MSNIFFLDFSPRHNTTLLFATPKCFARSSMIRALALPSVGGALTRIKYSPDDKTSTPSFLEFGLTDAVILIYSTILYRARISARGNASKCHHSVLSCLKPEPSMQLLSKFLFSICRADNFFSRKNFSSYFG